MKTFPKPSFTHFFHKNGPRGGGLPDFTRRGTNYLHTPLHKNYPKSKSLDSNGMFFGFSAPKIGGVLMKTFSKPSFTHFLQKWPAGGGVPDFTRCGTNYLHTPLLKKYPKSKSLDSNGMFFGFNAPKTGGVLMKTFSQPSFTHFSQKWPPGGGGVYQISPDVALTTCIHLSSKSTQRANLWTLTACFLDSTPPK